jgi:NADPH-dependent glutamate synthase beta subunit-like oxidoreductase
MMRADLPHEDAPGVIQALPFLTAHTRQLMGVAESEEYPLTDVEGKRVVYWAVAIRLWIVCVLPSASMLPA